MEGSPLIKRILTSSKPSPSIEGVTIEEMFSSKVEYEIKLTTIYLSTKKRASSPLQSLGGVSIIKSIRRC